MSFDFTFFGVSLLPFLVGIIALLRNETQLSDYILDWLGAVLFGLAAVASIQEVQAYIAGWQQAELVVRIVLTFVGVILTTKGYWPTARAMLDRHSDYNAATVGRGRFFGKY